MTDWVYREPHFQVIRPPFAAIASKAPSTIADVSITPTLTVGIVGASLAAADVAISPTLTIDMVGKGLAAATVAITPTLTIAIGSPGSASDVAINSTITVGITGKSNALSTVAISPTLTVDMEGGAQGSRVYPLAVHSSGRYFVNKLGEPTPLLEDMYQTVTSHLAQGDIATYVSWLRTNGFNANRWFMFTQDGSGTFDTKNEPNDFYNNVPFSTPNDFSTFNSSSAYALNMVKYAAKANAQEVMLNAFTLYLGFNGSPANQGWHEHVTDAANTNTVCFNLGAALANLFVNYPNVQLWLEGDYTASGTVLTRMQNLLQGWQSIMRTRIAGSEPAPPNSIPTAVQSGYAYGTNPATSDQQIQSYYGAGAATNGQSYGEFDSAYDAATTMPTYATDIPSYHNTWGSLNTREITRRIRMWALSCGGIRAGQFFANDDRLNSPVTADILATLTDVASADGALVNTLVRSLPHFLFRPTGTGTDHAGRALIGTGIGSGNTKVTACQTSDGAYLMAYCPRTDTTAAQTFEVDMRSMNSSPIRARWWNPTTGSYQTNTSAAGTYTLSNSASAQSFTTPGDNGTGTGDWILLLDATGSPADVSISSTITVGMTGRALDAATVAITPTLTVGISSGTALAGTVAISPTLTVDMTSKVNAIANVTISPILAVAMESQAGALGGTTAYWRPQYGTGTQIWRPPWIPPYS